MKTTIAFAAHNDDIELRAGGTVAKLVRSGYRVIYVVAIDSVSIVNNSREFDSVTIASEDILNVREKESREAAKIMGTDEPIFLHFKPSYYWTNETGTALRPNFERNEKHITSGMEQYKGKYFCLEAASQHECVNEIMNFIDSFNPEIVLTQNVNDFHLEHYSIASLAFSACQRLALERKRELSLYGWEMGSGGRIMPFTADRIIDITETFEIKLEALKPFASQGMNAHLHKIETSAKFWGSKIGVKYAEPFVKYLTAVSTRGFDQNNEILEYSSRVASDMHTEL